MAVLRNLLSTGALLVALLVATSLQDCVGFAGSISVPTHLQRSSELNMYPRKASPAQSSAPSKVAQKMIPNHASISPTTAAHRTKKQLKTRRTRKRYNTELSNSVLADCNTLPSFPTAHGILSPETVMRMEEMVETEGRTTKAVERFLSQYKREGPLSCLSMLSDPEVLPHLTKAMRDVV
ncbi:expressed unknown protein [Seminavis robusta]|uniref:Uncharacterized protein n=1 Tax=Seminavis robusta TaxID=568900 RepID=A0A9N8EA12_9STRA|nr:expressed unknown protein [Seminavis robusta]|eukprot:Sro865_g212890.1 n/a (180) ;mRNA; r:32803-33342